MCRHTPSATFVLDEALTPSQIAGRGSLSEIHYDALSSEGFYTLSIVANSASGNGYTVSADPQNAQAGDSECDPMTVTINAATPRGLRGPDGCWD